MAAYSEGQPDLSTDRQLSWEPEAHQGRFAHLRADRNAIADANRRNQAETQGGVQNTGFIGQLLG